MVRPRAATASTVVPVTRKPTAKPAAVMTTTPQATSAVSAPTRPETMESSRMGKLRNRSKSPPSLSSATPLAALMPWNSTPVTTKPGHQEVHVGEVARVADRTAEDVAEDEQEEQPLRRAGDQQRRRADELLERAGRHLAGGDEKRRALVGDGIRRS